MKKTLTRAQQLRSLIEDNDVDGVKRFIAKDPSVLNEDSFLHVAARDGHTRVCEALIDAGVDVNAGSTDSLGVVPLARASAHPETVKALLARGALPDGTDITPTPPLHTATIAGQLEVVKLLVAAGADIQRESLSQPMTALGWADFYRKTKPTGPVGDHLRELGAIDPYNAARAEDEDVWAGTRGEVQIELIERVLQGRVNSVPTERRVGNKTLTLRQSRFSADDYYFRLLFSVDFVAAGAPCEVALALPKFWPNHARALDKKEFRWPWDLLFAVGESLSSGGTLKHGDLLDRGDALFREVDWGAGFDQWVAVRYEDLAKKRKAVKAAGLDETLLLVPYLGAKKLTKGKAAKDFADRKAKTKWNETAGKPGKNTMCVPLGYDAPWLNGRWV